jgi:hypothetical protein
MGFENKIVAFRSGDKAGIPWTKELSHEGIGNWKNALKLPTYFEF